MPKNKGFTLVESLVVIILIVVLITIGIGYSRQNIKMAAINEGRMLIDSIVSQEKNYFAENYAFLTTANAKVSKLNGIIEDINTIGDYFDKFKISAKTNTEGVYTHMTLDVVVYPNTSKYPDFQDMYVRGIYDTSTNKIVYEENYGS